MVDIQLEPGENLILSSRAQFCDLNRFSQFKTGNAFLTNKRFVFKGRLQIRTWVHLIAVITKKGKRKFEISISSLKKIKKKRFENTIEIVFTKGTKEKKVLLKPERIPYLGATIGVGLGVVGEEIGKLVGESISGKIGEVIGEKTGAQIGYKAGELTGETMTEIQAKNLTDAWLKAFHYSMDQYPPGGYTEPVFKESERILLVDRKPVVLKDDHKKLPESIISKMKNPLLIPGKEPHRMKIISLWQILEEELGKNFADFEIPISQVEYFGELIDRIEYARNYRERELFFSQLRAYLRHIKQIKKLEAQKKG
jgi:hypothetical protein